MGLNMDDIVLIGLVCFIIFVFSILIVIFELKQSSRISSIEKNFNQISQSIESMKGGVIETNITAKNLDASANIIRTELSNAKTELAVLQTHLDTRQKIDLQTADSIKHVEMIIAGTQTKGAAGENILDIVFSKLPPEWQIRGFRVKNQPVEFALKLPNGLVLPIDSKWGATDLVEEFLTSDDPKRQQDIKKDIEKKVREKAKEVKKYISPGVTVNFGIAAVPDNVYELSSGILAELFTQNVVLLSYSMVVPYLLLVFQTTLKSSSDIDLHKLDENIQSAKSSISSLQAELEGRLSDAITKLNKSKSEMTATINKLNTSLSLLEVCSKSRLDDIRGDSFDETITSQ
jgi:DNA recombination protein RmuC